MPCTTHHHACECREAAFRRLIELAEGMCGDMADEIEYRYGQSLHYPSQALKYQRDMAPIIEIRAVLESLK